MTKARAQKAARDRARIASSTSREEAIRGIENARERPLDPRLVESFRSMDPELLQLIRALVEGARQDGWTEGCHDTERQYDERE
jgi:hypothetical protein